MFWTGFDKIKHNSKNANFLEGKEAMQEMATMALVFKNYIWKVKGTIIAKTVLKKSNKGGRLTISAFKMRCKAALIKTVCGILAEGTGSAEIDKWSQPIFLTKVQTIHWRKDGLFNIWYWKWHPCVKKWASTYITYMYIYKLKWIINLNIKCKVAKLSEESIGNGLPNLPFGKKLLDTAPKTAWSMKEKNEVNFV